MTDRAPSRRHVLPDSRPRYIRLADALLSDISAGRPAVNELLPTEHQLSVQYGLSRSTVREALRHLQSMGVIAKEHGVGTRVLTKDPRTSYVLSGRSATDVMGYTVKTKLVISKRRLLKADAALASFLQCDIGTPWIHLTGVRLSGESPSKPFSCIDLYIAGAYADLTKRSAIEHTPIYRLIEEESGIGVAEIVQNITASKLTDAEAKVLKAEKGSVAVHVIRRFLTAKGTAIEVTRNVHPADRFNFFLRLRQS